LINGKLAGPQVNDVICITKQLYPFKLFSTQDQPGQSGLVESNRCFTNKNQVFGLSLAQGDELQLFAEIL